MSDGRPATLDELPETLPVKPEGWTQKFAAHFNFGGGKGQSSYEVFDERNLKMPITLVRSTQGSGFAIGGVEPLLTWRELRDIWPTWIARAKAKVAAREKSR